MIVFTSDNGGYHQVTAQPPLRGAKSDAYEGGIRVPLIVRWPGMVKAGSVSDVPVSSVDFFPTFCEMASVKLDPKHKIDGVSLMPLLRQTGKFERDALFWHYPHYTDRTTPHGIVRQGDFKLIEYFEDGRLELYNLKTDIGEHDNLAASQRDKAREMQQVLADWRKQVGRRCPCRSQHRNDGPSRPQRTTDERFSSLQLACDRGLDSARHGPGTTSDARG